jgi:hypothetical protein
MAAPVAPTPAPPAPAPTAQQAIAERIQELRGQVTPEGALPAPVETPPAEQPRNPDGTFATPQAADGATAGEPGAEGEAPPAEGTEAPPAEDEFVELELQSAREPGKTFKAMLPKSDPALIEELRFLNNNGIRREEFNRMKAPVTALKEELDYVSDRIRLSPAAFVLETMAPEMKLEVALSVLVQEGVLEEAIPFIQKWTDPDKGSEVRRADRAEIARELASQKDTVSVKLAERRETRKFVERLSETADAIASVLPDPNRARFFVDDVLRDIEQVAARSEENARVLRAMAPADLVKLVGPRLELYGLTPEQAVAALDPSRPRLPTASPVGDTARAVAAAAAARATGKVFRQGADARRAAAAVPTPAGSAAPPALQPPKGQTIQERSGWLRQRLGLFKK